MKKILLSLFLILSFLLFPFETLAQDRRVVTIPQDEVITQDPYFAVGDSVEILGRINGDVFTASGEVIISGMVNGDLLVAGGNIRIPGQVTGNIRVIGGQIEISGRVDGGVSAAGGNITVTENASIGGYFAAAGGNVDISGPVTGQGRIAAGNINIRNRIDGSLDAAGGQIRLGPQAVIGRNFRYWSDIEAIIDENAQIAGETTRNRLDMERPVPDTRQIRDTLFQARLVANIFSALSLLTMGLLILWLFPRFMIRTADVLSSRPGPSIGIGLLALILAPFVIFALLITIIGIPLALIVTGAYFILIYIAKLFAIFWLGSRIVKEQSRYWIFIGGLFIYFILTLIPFVGGLAWLFATLFGLGALLITKREVLQEARAKKII